MTVLINTLVFLALALAAYLLIAGLIGAHRRQRSAAGDAAPPLEPHPHRADIVAREALASGEAPHIVLRDWLGTHQPAPVESREAETFVAALESRYSIVLPDDFRRYLLDTAPRTDMDDDNLVAWWGLERIKNLSEERGPASGYPDPAASRSPEIAREQDKYILFADYMISCWAWAICCSDGPNRGRIAVVGGKDVFVADGLSQFIRDYLTDEHELTHRGL